MASPAAAGFISAPRLPLLMLLMPVLMMGFAPRAVASVVEGPHIADLNVLLPPLMTNSVQYRLQGSGGCFSWSWDHHDILSVHPEYNSSSQCSTSARLVSIAPYNGRKETSVYATDIRTGTVIRCEVFIDMISRIKIFHHSVKLDLDGLATLRVHAFDEEDNVFSSVVGLQFRWQLMPKFSMTDDLHHLIHVPLKETPLSDCSGFCSDLETRIELEDRGAGSDLYVVKGVGIGHEVITVQLLEPQLEHVEDNLVLSVAESMSIDPPSPVYVTIGAFINYTLRVIRSNIPQVINLPSPHHRWSVVNSSVAQVDSAMGIAQALNLGITEIIVEDMRLSGHAQTSSLHVVIPGKLSLYILPITDVRRPFTGRRKSTSNIWYVSPGQEYLVLVKALSQGPDEKEIFITETNDLKVECDTYEHWSLLPVPSDIAFAYGLQNSRILKPISVGEGILTVSMTYLRGTGEMPEVLVVEQEIIVCHKVKLFVWENDDYPQVIRLPWVPGISQKVELKASGGCARTVDDYKWFSYDPETISVSASGFVQAQRPGQAIIKVATVFDPVNLDEVIVEASIPYSMIMVSCFPVEVAVGKQLHATVTLKTSDGQYYHQCDAFASLVKWTLVSGTEVFKIINRTETLWDSNTIPQKEDQKTLYGPPCAWTLLYAFGTGRAVLHATLSFTLRSYFPTFDGPLVLRASSCIAAYSPLIAHEAGDGNMFGGYWVDLTKSRTIFQNVYSTGLDKLFLVPGSAMNILLLGGPERWDQSVEYIDSVEILGKDDQTMIDGLLVEQAPASDGRLYRVLCRALGNFELLFSRGNLVGDDHPLPTVEMLELVVICSFPSFITLLPNEPVNTPEVIEAALRADRDPGRVRSPVVVANGCIIRMAAVGIHSTKRAFANSSSLSLNWELSGCESLAHWNYTNGLLRSGAAWERFLVLHNTSGICTVRATVDGFAENIASHLLGKASMLLKGRDDTLTDAVCLQLVSSLQVIPKFSLLLFHPQAKVNLTVTGGTSFLDAGTNDTKVVQIIQLTEGPRWSYLAVGARSLGASLVTVRDIGLSPPATAAALVVVANVEWIKIAAPEEISLMEGTTKTFDILAGAHEGGTFDSSQYMHMNIHVHLDEGILDLIDENYPARISSQNIHEPNFSVKASNIGTTTVYVSVRQQSGYEVVSELVKVEVYKQVRIHPGYIFLCPGASYKLTLEGGPKTGAFAKFDSENDEIAIVHSSTGRVSAISVGNATIHATVLGYGGTVVCEAYGQVEVSIPSAFSLNLQSDQLCVGCKMPIFPTFPEGNLFSFYEVCRDYSWIAEDEKVIMFQKSGQLNFDAFGVSIYGSDGKANSAVFDGNDIGFLNEVTGRSAGRTKISVSFSCDFNLSGAPHRVSYNASETLKVVPDPPLALGVPITWILPPFYSSSDLLQASSNSSGMLSSPTGSIVYSVLKACRENELLKQEAIVINGRALTTRESNNLACIQAKDLVTGRTEIASCVRVAEVAQVRLSTTESSFHVIYLPVHAKVQLVVRYTDYLGYTFAEAHGVVPLDVETNYPDIVSILLPTTQEKEETVILEANNPGRALVKLSLKHNLKAVDFIVVSVGAQLFPTTPILHVGDHVNFSIVGYGVNGLMSGQWLSANRSILSIDKKSGQAHACSEGVVKVIFEGSNSNLQTTVTVLKKGEISIDAPAETLTNVPYPVKGYRFSVTLSNGSDYKHKAAGDHFEIPYDCWVAPSFVGFTKPWINHETGSFYCLFFPYSPKQLVSYLSNSEETSTEGFLYISIITSLKEAPQVKGSAHALFVGGFSVSEVRKLSFVPSSNRSLITIIGNTDVEIQWNLKDLLLVRPLRRDGFAIGGHVEYEVKVLRNQKFTDKLIIALPATGQKEEIEVSYEPEVRAAPAGMTVTWLAILVCVIVLVLTIIFFIWLLDKPNRHQASSQREPISTSDSIQSSPRTPQPLVEYVRRTVDETPYYKRGGRRRFDPQYTY